MVKRGPGRPPKKRRGRPKGSRNKVVTAQEYFNKLTSKNLGLVLPHTPTIVDIDTRLDTAMTNLETAINEAITKLKGCI